MYDSGKQKTAGRRRDRAPLCLQQLSELSLPLIQTLLQLLQTGFSPLQWQIGLRAILQIYVQHRVCMLKSHGVNGSNIPRMLVWIENWGIWKPRQHLELFVVFLKPLLNHFNVLSQWKRSLPFENTMELTLSAAKFKSLPCSSKEISKISDHHFMAY